MEGAVYLLCVATTLACSVLLFRGYNRSKVRLLLWSALFFLGLALENSILFVDLVVTGPDMDLSLFRRLSALIAVLVLVYGLIWESH